MNTYSIRFAFLLVAGLLAAGSKAFAQFDDVYYAPGDASPAHPARGAGKEEWPAGRQDALYYDNEAYPYFGEEVSDSQARRFADDGEYDFDYDYYYSSRIRRFHGPFINLDFYSPFYTGFQSYDPFAWEVYSYPGANIYFNPGYSYAGYAAWRRWNRWSRWNDFYSWNNGCFAPPGYAFGYNSWCLPPSAYWGFGLYTPGYPAYYSNYYFGCPLPVSQYHGITETTIHVIHEGNARGGYYGPRITGNTGSSPRGPVERPGQAQPTFPQTPDSAAESNDKPRDLAASGLPGIAQPPARPRPDPDKAAAPKQNTIGHASGQVRSVPEDRARLKNTQPVLRAMPSPARDQNASGEYDRPQSRDAFRPSPARPSIGASSPVGGSNSTERPSAPRSPDPRRSAIPEPRTPDERPAVRSSPQGEFRPGQPFRRAEQAQPERDFPSSTRMSTRELSGTNRTPTSGSNAGRNSPGSHPGASSPGRGQLSPRGGG